MRSRSGDPGHTCDDVWKRRLTPRANYAYSASPDDPNEVSFAKGDVLDVVDTTGKWYQVRTPAGQVGVSRASYQVDYPKLTFQIAPSNYLTLL